MKCTFLIVSRTRAGKWRGEMLCSNEAKVGDYSPGRLCGWHDDVVNHPEAIRERYERSKIERQKQAREAKTDSGKEGAVMTTEAMRLRYRVYDMKPDGQTIVGRVGDAYDAAVLAMRGDRLVSYVFAEGDDAGQFVWDGDLQDAKPTLLDIVRQITNRISDIRDAEDEQRRDAEDAQYEMTQALHEEQAQKYGAAPAPEED